MKKFWFAFAALAVLFYPYALFAGERLADDVLAKKREGTYPVGLPLVNYTSDTGFGFGARAYLYMNGSRDDKNFAYEPYGTQIFAQFYMTTKNYHYHELNLDAYNIFSTNLRLMSSLYFEADQNAPYYGIGKAASKRKLTDPYTGRQYSRMSSYTEHFLKAGSRENYKYNKYRYTTPTFKSDVQGEISKYFKWIAGFKVSYWDIKSWQGRTFTLNGNKHTSGQTLFDVERPKGAEGGLYNTLKVGVSFSSLDFAPDPRRGWYVDYNFETSQKWIGSEAAFYRSTFGVRYYLTFWEPLTFALRLAYTMAQGDIPLYEMNRFAFSASRPAGLGGSRTLRGYAGSRFVAPTMSLANLEARFRFLEITPWRERFEFKLVLFADAGNCYSSGAGLFAEPNFGGYKYCGGAGLLIAWNQATIVHFYWGFSPEDNSISIDFGHAID